MRNHNLPIPHLTHTYENKNKLSISVKYENGKLDQSAIVAPDKDTINFNQVSAG